MLSSGVVPPDNRAITRYTEIPSRANCGIDLARVARKMPSDVTANR